MTARPDRVLELPAHEEVAGLIDPWRELVASQSGSYFQLPDWVMSWWETTGGRAPTQLAVWHGPTGLEAIAAVSATRSRLHPRLPVTVPVLVNTGSGAGGADHLGFPAIEERRSDVRSWLTTRTTGSLVLSNLDDVAARQVAPLDHVVVEQPVCPRMPIGADHPIGRSSSYRRQVRSKVRKATAAGARFRYVPPGHFGEELLDRLMELHELRWSELEGTSAFGRDRLALHRRLIDHAAADRGPAAVVAESGPDVVGIVYGFVWNGTFAFFQSGWDPSWSRLGLGTVVHAVAFELLAEAGVHTYDFLRGGEEYKYRFGATDVSNTSIVVPRGVGGAALRMKHHLRSRRDQRVASA